MGMELWQCSVCSLQHSIISTCKSVLLNMEYVYTSVYTFEGTSAVFRTYVERLFFTVTSALLATIKLHFTPYAMVKSM